MKPFRCNPSGNEVEVFLTLAVEAETELMSFDWASGCGSRDVTVWFQTRSAERESLRPHTRTRLQAWRQHSGVTLPIITLRRLPLSLSSFSERNKRRGKFQKDKIPNWKWQISPPSFIQNRPAVSVSLWAHFHTHSQSLYTDQVSRFHTKPVCCICSLYISRFHMHFYWNTSHCAISSLRFWHASNKTPTQEAFVDLGQFRPKCTHSCVAWHHV